MADADASNQDCRLTARSRLLGVFFLFAVIACLRFSVIATPPHWDAILGPFPEAIWLKNHGFDYSALIHKELRYEKGGPVTYGWSVVPTVYAVLLTLFPPQVVFAILHLANFFLAAVIAVTLYGLLRDLLRLERLLAIGWVAVLLVQPMFAGQIDAINMEIPAAAAILLAADAMLRERYGRALLLSLVALFVKDAASLLCAANLGFAAMLALARPGRPRWRMVALFLLPLAIRWGMVTYVFSNAALGTSPQAITPTGKWDFKQTQVFRCVPDIFVLYLALLGLSAAHLRGWRATAAGTDACALRAGMNRTLTHFGAVHFYGLLVISLFVAVFLFMFEPLCRYFTWYLPFLTLALAAAVQHFRPSRQVQALCILVPLLFGALNSYGALYPSLPWYWRRSGELLERSREYLLDVRSNQRTARFLETNAAGAMIVTTCPMDRMLTLPELGYVSRPLNVYTVWTRPTYAPVKSCADLTPQNSSRIVLVYQPTVFGYGDPKLNLEPRPSDKPIYVDRVRGAPTIVYRLHQGQPGPGPAPRSRSP